MNTVRLAPLLLALSIGTQAREVDFNREIRPILSDKCIFCHGPDKEHRKAKLRLDVEDSAKNPKNKVVVPGDPQASELIYRITTDDEDDLDKADADEYDDGVADHEALPQYKMDSNHHQT